MPTTRLDPVVYFAMGLWIPKAISCGSQQGHVASKKKWARALPWFVGAAVFTFASPSFAKPDMVRQSKPVTTVALGQIIVTAPTTPILGLPLGIPTKVLTASAIEARGVRTLGAALRLLPIFGSAHGLGTGSTSKFTNGGEESADLFGLGKSRVVILVNGQRWIQGFEGDTDLSTLPIALIQRIEVFPARGGVVYGNGAIAGVINIITVNGLDGGRASVASSIANGDGHWDGQRESASLAIGTSDADSGITAVLSWLKQRPISASQRAITSGPLPGTGVSRDSLITPYGQYEFYADSGPYTNSPLCSSAPNGASFCNLMGAPNPSATAKYIPYSQTSVYNTYPDHYLIMPMERFGLYLSGFHHFGDQLTARASAFVGRRNAAQIGPPSTIVLGTGGLPISVSKDQPYNPFGITLLGSGPNANLIRLARRFTEAGPLSFNETSDTYRATFDLSGTFTALQAPWNWSLGTLWSSSQVQDTNYGRLNLSNLALALGNPTACTAVPGCIPIDVFGGPGTLTPSMLRYVDLTENNHIQNQLRTVSVNISSPRLATLPAGSLGLAIGAQYLQRDGSFTPAQAAALGVDSAAPYVNVPPYAGGYHGNALYAQALIPLIAGRYRTSLGIGTRVFDYSSFGSGDISEATLNFHASSALLLQAGWTQGFRAPNLRELGQIMPGSPAAVTDPCSDYGQAGNSSALMAACAQAGVPSSYTQNSSDVATLKVGNTQLTDERSNNGWLNAVWNPSQVPGLRVHLGYYRLRINNAIGRPSPQQVLNDCYLYGIASTCGDVQRSSNGTLISIFQQTNNASSLLTDWISLGLQYHWLTNWGTFQLRLNSAWVHRYILTTATVTGGTHSTNLAGEELGAGALPNGLPRWVGNTTLAWQRGPWELSWTIRLIGPMTEPCSDYLNGTAQSYTALGLCSQPDLVNPSHSRNHMGTTVYHDIEASYMLSNALTITAGIDNLFAKEPPISISQPIYHYDPTIYPAPGRRIYASLSYAWGT